MKIYDLVLRLYLEEVERRHRLAQDTVAIRAALKSTETLFREMFKTQDALLLLERAGLDDALKNTMESVALHLSLDP